MALYESVVIARQDLSSQKVKELVSSLDTIITEQGGKIVKTESWGLRNLAYRIKKNRKGHYVLFNIDAPAEAISEYERKMRINEDVLRYLTLKIDSISEEPSILAVDSVSKEDKE